MSATTAGPIYCFDTSAFLHCAQRHYPVGHFKSLWAQFDALAQSGRLISSDEVLGELGRNKDEVHAWCDERKSIFEPLSAPVMNEVKSILGKYKSLASEGSNRNRADAFVIAVAKLRNATVVTYEQTKPSQPKIPDVCRAMGIPMRLVVDIVRDERWTF